jgi:DNA-binding Lrp family transcriptional regulator
LSPDSRFWHHPGVSVLPRISPPTGFDIAATSRGHRAVQRNRKGPPQRRYRTSKLEGNGVIKASRLAVEVTLADHTAQDMRRFEERVLAAPEVALCYATGSGVDYMLHVVSRDIDHYQRFIDSLLTDDIGISMADSVPD